MVFPIQRTRFRFGIGTSREGHDGSIDRTGDRIFLLTPANVNVAATEMDRLRDRGLVR